MKLNEIFDPIKPPESYIIKYFEHDDGEEVPLKVHYDYMPEQKQTRHDPHYDAEIEIFSVLTKLGKDVLSHMDEQWMDEAKEEALEKELDKKVDHRY